jgi:hypothetical protein
MKLMRKYKTSAESNTFYLPIALTGEDVRYTLTDTILSDISDDPMGKDFWVDAFSAYLGRVTSNDKPLSCAGDIGEWAFNLALNRGYLRESREENRYEMDVALLRNSKRGRKPQDTEE